MDASAVAAASFNLGLCWHALATQGSRDTPILLDRAVEYYQTARQLLVMQQRLDNAENISKLGFVADDPMDHGRLFLSLALLNNMGHIFQRRHDWTGVRRCLDELHSLLPGRPDGAPPMMLVAVATSDSAGSSAPWGIRSRQPEAAIAVLCLPLALTMALHPSRRGLNVHAAAA
jgi:hypothetical protein